MLQAIFALFLSISVLTKAWSAGSYFLPLHSLLPQINSTEKQLVTPTPQPTPEITPSPTPSPFSDKQKAHVISVADGDTFQVDIEGKKETIRVIGIDTPETVDPRKPVQCFGKEASEKAKSLLNGKDVYLEKDESQSDRDKYQRLLRTIYLEDNTNFGLFMISEGFAHEYTYDSNPYVLQKEYKDAEHLAQENGKGLWGVNACPTPTPTSTPTPTLKPTLKPAVKSAATSSNEENRLSCTGPDLDCDDFSTHAQAQSFFEHCGFTAQYDPMKLDSVGVGDGVACESRP